MTTMTMTNQATVGDRRGLEELVDRVMDALLGEKIAESTPSVARSVHDARRMRRAGDLDGALAVLGGVDTERAAPNEARWAYSEWMDLARRRFARDGATVYSQGTGRVKEGDLAALQPSMFKSLAYFVASSFRRQSTPRR